MKPVMIWTPVIIIVVAMFFFIFGYFIGIEEGKQRGMDEAFDWTE